MNRWILIALLALPAAGQADQTVARASARSGTSVPPQGDLRSKSPSKLTPRTLTLESAVRLALERNPDAVLARIENEKAAAQISVARGAFSPQAYLGSGLGWTEGIPQSVEGATPSIVQATARMPVYNRALRKRVREAEAGAEAAEHVAAAKQDEVAYRVAVAYLDFEYAVRRVEFLESRRDRLARVAQTVQQRVDEGRAIPLEATKANLDRARAEESLRSAQGEAALLETTLRIQLGLDPAERLIPADISSAGDPRELATLPAAASEGADRALANSAELRGLEAAARSKNLAVQAEQGAYAPRLDFVAQYALLAKFNNFEEFFNRFQRHNGQVGLALQVPVFTGKAVSSRVAKASVEAREAQARLAARKSAVAVESHRLFQNVQDAESAQKLAQLELDYARESLGVLLTSYQEGAASLEEVERARALESQTWDAFYDAKYALEKAKLNLLRRTGELAASLR